MQTNWMEYCYIHFSKSKYNFWGQIPICPSTFLHSLSFLLPVVTWTISPSSREKKKRKPGARELISMLLNHTYKLHITYTSYISYTYVSYIYTLCLRKTETLDLKQNNCNVISLVQKGNNPCNNAIIKKSKSILTLELDNDLISFSHCWCQQILLSRQWEANCHEVCWVS